MGLWDGNVQALNHGTKDELQVIGYCRNPVKLGVTCVLTVLTGGLLLIPLTWRPSVKLSLTHTRCDLSRATTLLVKDVFEQVWEESVVREGEEKDGKEKEGKGGDGGSSAPYCTYFTNKKIKYVWDETTCSYIRLRPLDHGTTFGTFHRNSRGLSQAEAESRLQLYGENFMQIDVLSIWQLIVQQAYNPFYIFQAYTVVLWSVQSYYVFAACITALAVTTISIMVWETRRQSRALRKTLTSQSEVTVLRDGGRTTLSSREVVPGDVLLVGEGPGRLEVDAVLLQGSAVVNEAMLTGESVPITKVSVPREDETMFNEDCHRRHFLYSGTEVLQVRGATEIPVLVVNTGFYTARGELVRSILFPKPIDFHFYADFLKLLGLFFVIGVAAMVWSLVNWCKVEPFSIEILLLSFDLITFVVPSILPATITAINAYTQQRLKRKDVFCLSSNYISLSGSVDLVCFDKTGTLTEDDLALAGVLPCVGGEVDDPLEDISMLPPQQPLARALASCHALTKAHGRILGYPIDTKIFLALGWNLEEVTSTVYDYATTPQTLVRSPSKELEEEEEVAILKIFPFESREQRMTVVAQRRSGQGVLEVFVKGAPERVAAICNPGSVPGILGAALEWYTRQGLRVVAVAGKQLPQDLPWDQVDVMARGVLEEGSVFLGLVLLQNKLKPQTPPVLATLRHADITSVMITGDNLLTAVSVARQSGLVEEGQQLLVVKAHMATATTKAAQHLKVTFYDIDYQGPKNAISIRNDNYVLATDGDSFDLIHRGLDKDLFQRLIHKGRVFARMKPDQKITVVEALQDLGHQVAMCGDGCNDCGALKVAHAGISLSSAEASVAAPFTSKQEDITCVPTLLLEGRATLVSIFTAFKYNVASMFGALICVLFHFSVFTEPSDGQYVTMDIILCLVPALVVGNTGATDLLVPRPPTKRILTFLPAASIFSFLLLQTLLYWLALLYLRAQSWFVGVVRGEYIFPPSPTHENTTLVLLNFYTYVIGAVVFSHGKPYRKPIYTNYILAVYLVVATVFCVFVTFYTGDWLVVLLNLSQAPDPAFNGMLFLGVLTFFVVAFMWEHWLLYGVVQDHVLPWVHRTCGPFAKFEKIEAELREKISWPSLTPPPDWEEELAGGGDEAEALYNEPDSGAEGEDSLLVRKLTRRHRFKATVKYTNESKTGHTSSTKPGLTIAIDQTETDMTGHGPLSGSTLSPESATYKQPWDSLEGGSGSAFRFNQSVRHQIMKGTTGGFSTFKGSIKRNQPSDTSEAEPYEIIHLADHNSAQPIAEEIYATIDETMSGDQQGNETLPDIQYEPTQSEQQFPPPPPPQPNNTLKMRTEQQKSEMDNMLSYVEDLQDTQRRVKFAEDEEADEDGEEQRSSLMETIDATWRRLSSVPSGHAQAGIGETAITADESQWIAQDFYDVPRPPRPVDTQTSQDSQEYREHHNQDHNYNQDHNCNQDQDQNHSQDQF